MSNFIKVLLNIRSLKAVARELTIEQLEDGLSKLTAVIDELRSQKQAEQRQSEERARKIAEYKALMAADGIDASELLGTVEPKTTSTRAPRPPKYAYLDDNGQQQTWTGQGRQPLPIRRAIESGAKNLADFLINA
jgi:DNA-binding protein H-NS